MLQNVMQTASRSSMAESNHHHIHNQCHFCLNSHFSREPVLAQFHSLLIQEWISDAGCLWAKWPSCHQTKSVKALKETLRYVFQRLPEPNRACLVGVYAFLIWNNLCDLVYQTPTKSYQSQIPVAFGIPGHVTTKHLPDTPC